MPIPPLHHQKRGMWRGRGENKRGLAGPTKSRGLAAAKMPWGANAAHSPFLSTISLSSGIVEECE